MNGDHPDQRVVLARHAETEWSLTGQHTGTSDIPLTEVGRAKAKAIGERLAGAEFARTLVSPLRRAGTTADLAGHGDDAQVREALREWDYGDYEGLTTAEIRQRRPGWVLWTDGAPNGESPAQVQARADELVAELCAVCEDGGDALIFGHGHMLRALAVRWIGLPIAAGRLFRLSTGAISALGWKREIRVVDTWNDDAHLDGAPPAGDTPRTGVPR